MGTTLNERQLTPRRLRMQVEGPEPFTSPHLEGIEGKTDQTGELPSGLRASYRNAKGVRYTFVSHGTPVCWVVGSGWTVPDGAIDGVPRKVLDVLRRAAGLR